MKADELNDLTSSPAAEVQARRPYWWIGLGLLALVLAVLGAAFFLDRQLRPRVGMESAPVGTPSVPTPTLMETATKVSETPVVAIQATASPQSVGAGSPVVSQAPSLVTVSPPIAEPSTPQAVEQAYLRYWDVYREALLHLDTSRLSEVAARDELHEIETEIEGF